MFKGKIPVLIAAMLLTVTGGADTLVLVPAMAAIANAFPNVGITVVNFVITISSLALMPTSLLAAKLIGDKKLTNKTSLVVGVILFSAAGAGGALMPNLYGILAMMAIKGIGNGLVAAPIVSVIAEYFNANERPYVNGFMLAVGSIITIPFAILSGYLVEINWRYSFLTYLPCLIIALYYFIVLKRHPAKMPDIIAEEEATRKKAEELAAQNAQYKPRMGKRAFVLYAISAISFTFGSLIYLLLAGFIEGEGLGTSVQAGYISTVALVTGIFAGTSFGVIYKTLKKFTLTFYFGLLAIGHLMLFSAQNITVVAIAVGIYGFGIMGIMPYLLTEAAIVVPLPLIALAGAIIRCLGFGTAFVSSFIPQLIASLFHTESFRVDFLVVGIVFAVMSLFITVYYAVNKKERQSAA